MKTIALFAALVPMGAAFGAWTVEGGDVSPAEPIAFAKVAGHSHHCRKPGVSEETTDANLFAWTAKYHVDAFGVGSPWTISNQVVYSKNERADRDRYFGGLKNDQMEEMMDVAGNNAMLAGLNARGGGTLYYLDNETPKSCFGHMWYVGFKQTVPAWHDYSQDRPCWYSDYDNDTAERNALTGDYQRRRTYATIVAEQRSYGALAIWAHPTSWWTKDGKNKGPFVTNIATDMIPQLMRDGYLDGMTVQGYDPYHADYQNLWFALLDLGYRVPGFSELDLSPSHGIEEKGTMLFNWIPFLKRPLTIDVIKAEFRAAHHTMSSGPGLYMKVDGNLQGAELESGAGKTHKVEVFAWPADGEKTLSRVQLLGRGGKVLAEKRDFAGGRISWTIAGDAEGGWLVARVFGENDADFAEKRQQIVKHCALTNPVWLRTDAFRAPKPIPAPDPLTIREVRELEDFLLKGEFRFDPRVTKELEPGMVPVWAFQIDKVRAALERAAKRPLVVACVGDSITYGHGASKREKTAYPAQLQALLGDGWTVLNFGHNARTALDEGKEWNGRGGMGYRKSPQLAKALESRPDVVLFMLGTNDSKPVNWNDHADDVKRDYEKLVDDFLALTNAPVVVIAASPFVKKDSFSIRESVVGGELVPWQRELAQRRGLPLVDAYSATKAAAATSYIGDGVHPNDAGYGVLAEAFAAKLRELEPKLRAAKKNAP
ncbi:MAG: hypothetical protein IJG18_10805 [Kiritimatiellae bacterium]|nr:hypothetical protein [Kiritimatiellia bacterium]